MKLRYIFATLLAVVIALLLTGPDLDLDLSLDDLEDTPLVRTALDDRPIDPNSYTIEVHPRNEIKILGSRPVEGGHALTIYSSAPLVKYGDRVFEFREPARATFFVPDDRRQEVRLF